MIILKKAGCSVTENVTPDSVTKSNHIQLNHLSTGRQLKKVRFRIDEDISEAEEEISDNFGPELKNIIKEHPQLVSEDMEHAVDRMFEPCYLEPFNPDVKLSFKDGNFDSLTKNEKDYLFKYNLEVYSNLYNYLNINEKKWLASFIY